jgi:hypothetical protein
MVPFPAQPHPRPGSWLNVKWDIFFSGTYRYKFCFFEGVGFVCLIDPGRPFFTPVLRRWFIFSPQAQTSDSDEVST